MATTNTAACGCTNANPQCGEGRDLWQTVNDRYDLLDAESPRVQSAEEARALWAYYADASDAWHRHIGIEEAADATDN